MTQAAENEREGGGHRDSEVPWVGVAPDQLLVGSVLRAKMALRSM